MGDADQKALNALAKGAGVTAIGMFVSKALTYLYRVSIARFVGPEAYGQLSLALMVTGIASTIAYLALGQGLKKFIPEFRARGDVASIKGAVLGTLQMSLPASIILWGLTFFGAEFIALKFFDNPSLIPLLKIISFTIITGVLSRTFFDTTLGFNKIIYKTGVVRVLQNTIQLGVTVVLLTLGFNVISAAWGWFAGSASAMLLGLYFLERKVGPILTSKVNAKYQRKKLLKFSSPLLLSSLIATITGWTDTALLGYYMSDFEVGLYNAALPTAMIMLLPDKAVGSLALPSFSELKERESKSLEESLKKSTYWISAITLPIFILTLFYAEDILSILFGSTYGEASTALIILAIGYTGGSLLGQIGSILESTENTNYMLYNSMGVLTANLILNIVLIPKYGITGAAFATAFSTLLGNILVFLEVWKEEKIISVPFYKILKVLISAVLPLALLAIIDMLAFTNTPYWALIPLAASYFLLYALLHLKIIGIEMEEEEIFLRVGEIIGRKKEIALILKKIK